MAVDLLEAPHEDRTLALPGTRLACSTSQSAITPCTTSASVLISTNNSTQFTVQNKTIEPVSYGIACVRTGQVASCNAPGSLTVNPNSSKSFTVTWVASGTPGSGTLTATADDGFTPVTGTNNVTVTLPPSTPLYVAQVSPHLQRHLVDSGQADTARFVIRNSGADSTGWSWTVGCTGSAIVGGSCSPTSGSAGLAAGAQTTVAVAFTTTGAKNAQGGVTLTFSRSADATRRDSGTVELLVTRNDSLVQVSQQNPGESVEPDQCVTVSVARGLAAECGALRATWAFPSLRTFNKVRAPVLLYNSQHAHPRPVVRADLTLPDTRSPDSVTAVLKDSVGNAISGASGTWPGSQWRARSTRRVAVSWDGLAWPHGIHSYSLTVTRWYAGVPELGTVTGRVVVVNRASSSMGAGWGIAGLEQVWGVGADLLWVGGDGAARRYVAQGAGVWVAPALDRLDTLVSTGGWLERRLPHGLKVRFAVATGLHTQTVNRLGHVTRFVWTGGRLDSIVAPSGVTSASWALRYNGSGVLREVEVIASGVSGRKDSLTSDGGGRITSIKQRDGTTVQFSYDGTETNRLITRTDPRGVRDSVAYTAGSVVSKAKVARDLANATFDSLLLTVAETRGIVGSMAPPLDRASTVIDGFRTDVADTMAYLVNKWGAPTRVRNALGDETQLTRANGTFPALVTTMRAPNGRVLVATYDTRGNIATLLDSATVKAGPVYALTQYTWDGQYDFVIRVINPEGDSTKSGYDAANGNLLWREDGRGSSTRTNFTYSATTGLLVKSVTAIGVLDSLVYEPTFNNAFQRTNVLNQWERWAQDGAGRVVATRRPVGADTTVVVADSVVFDSMDRPTTITTRSATDTLIVTQGYTAAGQLQRITKRSSGDAQKAQVDTLLTTFAYDGRNRVIAETTFKVNPGVFIKPDTQPHFQYLNALAFTYDPAGNLIVGGRNPFTVTYDALNRPIVKSGSDISTFVFDEVGNLREAFNPVARVARAYGRNGTLLADSLRIATRRLSDRIFDQNVFGIGARYDLNLRRVAFRHPQTVAPAPDSQRTWFNSASGFADSVGDILGNRFTFVYDNDGRPTSITRLSQSATPVLEALTYDAVGRLRTRIQRAYAGGSPTDTLHKDSLAYDLKDRITRNFWTNDQAGYNALGPLDTVGYGQGGYEAYRTDALGLRYYGNGNAALNGSATYAYIVGTERLDKMIIKSPNIQMSSADTTLYQWSLNGTSAGENRRRRFCLPGTQCTWTDTINGKYLERRTITNGYDASWRLIANAYRIDTTPAARLFYVSYNRVETYRYDPLGRRVWKEMIRDTAAGVCLHNDASSGCRNEVTRTVWDNANILYDIRKAADTAGATSEGYPSAGTFVGSVGYTHAGGIDVPLDLFKGTSVVVPVADWRGTFDKGTCPTARCTDNQAWFPLKDATSFGDTPAMPSGPPNWSGELIGGQTDGSGFRYQRNRYYDSRSGRFTQEDPIGLAGGLSAYGFANGDPISYQDPMGLWSPRAHSILLSHALGKLVSAGTLLALDRASQAADRSSNQFNNGQHSTRNLNQDRESAIMDRENFVANEMASAKAMAAAGDRAGALGALGRAMHARMDETSPAHRDEIGAPASFPGSGHSPTDNVGKETSKAITPDILARNDKTLRAMFTAVFPTKK